MLLQEQLIPLKLKPRSTSMQSPMKTLLKKPGSFVICLSDTLSQR